MRQLLLLLFSLLFFGACAGPHSAETGQISEVAPQKDSKTVAPAEQPKQQEAQTKKSILVKPQKPLPEPELAAAPKHPLRYQNVTSQGVTFSIVSFDTRDHFLAVADQEPGKRWKSASQAARSIDGVAGINAGFFNTDSSPLGLVKARGKRSGHWNSQSSLASGVYQFSKGTSSLQRNKFADRSSPELVQSGPFLVENGELISGLSATKSAQRSLILWNGKHHMAMAMTSTCTLKKLSTAVDALPAKIPHYTALNLDGGRSCDLYINEEVSGGPAQKNHWLKNNVRNYLILVRK